MSRDSPIGSSPRHERRLGCPIPCGRPSSTAVAAQTLCTWSWNTCRDGRCRELTFGSRLPLARSRRSLTAVLKGLSAAHSAGSCTATSARERAARDRGDIKIHRLRAGTSHRAGDHRASLLGTAAYLAPEQTSTVHPRPAQRPLQLRHPGLRDVRRPCAVRAVPRRRPGSARPSGCPTQRFREVDRSFDELCEKATARPRGPVQTAAEMLAAVSRLRRQVDLRPAPALHSTAPAIAAAAPFDDPETMVVQTEMAPPEEPAAAPESQDEPAVAVVGPPTHKPQPPRGSNRDAAGVRWSFCCWPG